MSKLHCSVCGTELLPHECDGRGMCDEDLGRSVRDEGRAVREAPVRPTRTAGPPSGATVALLVLGCVLAVVAWWLPQGAGWAGENVLALYCGVGAGVAGLWGLCRWDGEAKR